MSCPFDSASQQRCSCPRQRQQPAVLDSWLWLVRIIGEGEGCATTAACKGVGCAACMQVKLVQPTRLSSSSSIIDPGVDPPPNHRNFTSGFKCAVTEVPSAVMQTMTAATDSSLLTSPVYVNTSYIPSQFWGLLLPLSIPSKHIHLLPLTGTTTTQPAHNRQLRACKI